MGDRPAPGSSPCSWCQPHLPEHSFLGRQVLRAKVPLLASYTTVPLAPTKSPSSWDAKARVLMSCRSKTGTRHADHSDPGCGPQSPRAVLAAPNPSAGRTVFSQKHTSNSEVPIPTNVKDLGTCSPSNRVDLKSNDWCPCKKGIGDTRGSQGGPVKVEAETGGMQSQAKECPKSPEVARNEERSCFSDAALFLAMKVSRISNTCPGFGSAQARPRDADRHHSETSDPGLCRFPQEEHGPQVAAPEVSTPRWPGSLSHCLQDSCSCQGSTFRNFDVVVVTAWETDGEET